MWTQTAPTLTTAQNLLSASVDFSGREIRRMEREVFSPRLMKYKQPFPVPHGAVAAAPSSALSHARQSQFGEPL